MKLIYCFSLFIILCIPLHSQWYFQHPCGEDKNFTAVSFVDSLNGWVCGDRGIIMHTSDGGNNWIQLDSKTEIDLKDIKFFSLTSGWAVGKQGAILHTTDGGYTWLNKSRASSEELYSVSPINDSSCWCVGYSNLVVFTSNHGNTWFKKFFALYGNPYYLLHCKFFDNKKGWIAGGFYTSPFSGGVIGHTTDGGINWNISYNGMGRVFGLSFYGEKFGWALGDPHSHFRTTDYGSTWYPISIFQNDWMNKVSFADSLHGWASALPLNGTTYADVFRTTDGGNSWVKSYGSLIEIGGFSYINKNVGWVVGSYGSILKSTDGGQNWITQYPIHLTNYDIASIFFINKEIGWAGGIYALLKTTNGGARWDYSKLNFEINSIYFVSATKGFASAWNKLMATTDGGKTWFKLLEGLNSEYQSIHFSDSLNGWFTIGKKAYNTTNGGTTWQVSYQDTAQNFRGLYFFDKNKGYLLGESGKLHRTTDGGLNWVVDDLFAVDKVTCISFFDSLNGLIAGYQGQIFKTSNGGFTWDKYSTGNDVLLSVCMTDQQNAWVAGGWTDGIIKRSTDGGITWNTSPAPLKANQTLKCVFFADSVSGWVSGRFGAILKHGSPIVTDIQVKESYPESFTLFQNYPNPFNPITIIRYIIPNEAQVHIIVYDILGKEITTLVNDLKKPGTYEINFNASVLSSGVYFYRMIADGNVVTRKALLVK